jgi:hypothetical protein
LKVIVLSAPGKIVVKNNEGVSMQITDVAKVKLTEMLKNSPGKYLRVYIRGSG